MNLTVNAAGVFFYGDTPPSGSGFVIDPDGLEGLNDGISARGEAVQRPRGHGDYDLPTFLDSRIVSLSGNCLADTPMNLALFGRMLTGLLADSSGRVTFTHLGNTMWGSARLAPGTQKKFKVASATSTEAKFQVQLKFADPRLFGETRTFPNGDYTLAQVHHRGNFPATPIHTVTGTNATGYTINGPDGRKFTVAKAVVAGSPHVIDMSTGWLTINGVVQTGAVTVADLWSIPGGVQVAHSITGAGLALKTTAKDTYI